MNNGNAMPPSSIFSVKLKLQLCISCDKTLSHISYVMSFILIIQQLELTIIENTKQKLGLEVPIGPSMPENAVIIVMIYIYITI